MHHSVSRALCATVFALGLAACGGPSTTDGGGGSDAVVDVSRDRSLDAPSDIASDQGTDVAPDVAPDIAPDVAPDVPADVANDVAADINTDDASTCSSSAPCHAFWCGCGSCNPADIICVSDARGCPLGCVSSCPEVATTVCSCSGGACAVVTADAGADASTDGGPAGTPCSTDTECASGLLCCYPCGIPGCHNQCMSPMGDHCPLLP